MKSFTSQACYRLLQLAALVLALLITFPSAVPAVVPEIGAFRDPLTGELRAPTEDERRAVAAPAKSAVADTAELFDLPGGGDGMRLPSRLVSQARAHRGPDGALHLDCAQSHPH